MNAIISFSCNVEDALKQLNETCVKALYVVNNKNQLVGSITDGDIRRSLLDGFQLNNNITDIMYKTPRKIYYNDYNKELKLKEYFKQGIFSVPIVDENNKIIDIAFSNKDKILYSKKKNKVFLLAGGRGTRLEPFTKILPKPLVPLGDKAIIEIIIDKFSYYGFHNFIISVNYKADMIKLYLNEVIHKKKDLNINYVDEKIPLGTIGSLYLAKGFIDDDFFISNSDILINEDMEKIYKYHKNKQAIITIIGCKKKSIIPYGVLKIKKNDKEQYLETIDEKPINEFIINTGMYVASKGILKYVDKEEKMDMTDLINNVLADKNKIAVYFLEEEQWLDIGQWNELKDTQKYFL